MRVRLQMEVDLLLALWCVGLGRRPPWWPASGGRVGSRGSAPGAAPPSPTARSVRRRALRTDKNKWLPTSIPPALCELLYLHTERYAPDAPFLKNTFNLSWKDFVSLSLEPIVLLRQPGPFLYYLISKYRRGDYLCVWNWK